MTDPPTDLALRSATDVAPMVRERQVSARELLDAVVDRYQRHNPTVNAVVVTRLEEAADRAAAADRATARGESWGPLHGVPMTIKEAFDWVGTPTTWGVPALASTSAGANAAAVDRLLAAGAVIYGKTNVPLNLADWQSFNAIYGTTNNPWDLSRSPGGSSGGAAAALATGMATLELGTDIGSSVRNPAHYCGVFGHKPTFGLVPMAGATYPGRVAAYDIDVAGPMARTAADLDLALGVLAGTGRTDASHRSGDLPAARHTTLEGLRVGVMLDSPCVAQDDELTEQLQATVEVLGRAGSRIDDRARPVPDQRRAFELYVLLLRATTAFNVAPGDVAAHAAAAARYDDGERDYRAVTGKAVGLSHREWYELHEERLRLRASWAAYFADHDVLLCPTAASAAVPHDHEGERADRTIVVNGTRQPAVDQLFWAGLGGMVYLPGTVAPAGLTRSGLPCGIQVVAPHLGDRDGIAVAGLIEREVGGFVAPPGYG